MNTEIIKKAIELLETKGWTQGAYARNAEGAPIYRMEPEACSFCLSGALSRAYMEMNENHDDEVDPFYEEFRNTRIGIIDIIRKKYGADQIITFNDDDGRTKEEVVGLLKEALNNG